MVATPGEGASRQTLQCSWPVKFFEKRGHFYRDSENQPYIAWLGSAFKAVDDASGLEVDEDDEENEESEEDEVDAVDAVEGGDEVNGIGIQDESETKSDDQRYIERLHSVFSEYFDSVKKADGKTHERREQSKAPCDEDTENGKEVRDARSVARIFMLGMTGNEEILPYRDQVDVVAGFLEKASFEESEKPVAFLHDMMSGRRSPISQEDYKPQAALNLNELRVRLSKQVTNSMLSQSFCKY